MNDNTNKKPNKKSNKKKWLILGTIGTALLLLPRRSSRLSSGEQQPPTDV